MDEAVMLGSEGNILEETPEHCHRLRVPRPVVTNADLEKIRHVNQGDLKATTLLTVFQVERNEKNETINAGGTLKKSLENLFQQADEAISNGHTILVLSDRDINKENIPIPILLACSGLHHHLIRRGTRTKVSLVLETGEAREMHHFAVLIGYGANVINPYLAFETLENEINNGDYPGDITYAQAHANFFKATAKSSTIPMLQRVEKSPSISQT